MTEPRTAAGGDLLDDLIQDHEGFPYRAIERVRDGILAIEAEAAALDVEPAHGWRCSCGWTPAPDVDQIHASWHHAETTGHTVRMVAEIARLAEPNS